MYRRGNNESTNKSDENAELVDLSNVETQKTSNGNNSIKIKSNVQDDLCSVSHQHNKLGNVIVDKPIKVFVFPKIIFFNIIKNVGN